MQIFLVKRSADKGHGEMWSLRKATRVYAKYLQTPKEELPTRLKRHKAFDIWMDSESDY